MIEAYNDEAYVVYTEDGLINQFIYDSIKSLSERLIIYKSLFNVDRLNKLSIYCYTNLDNYRSTMNNMPEYSRGYINSSTYKIVVCNVKEVDIEDPFYHKKTHSIAHEAFHIYYSNYVYKDISNRVIWFDEGMARYLSGELDGFDLDNHKEAYKRFRDEFKPIANLNDRIHGSSDISDELIFNRRGVIDGYYLSYIIIRYLVETKGIEYVKDLMNNKEEILKIGNSIIDEVLDYFDLKFNYTNKIK